MSTWKPIPGYEGYYEASDDGRIRSLDRVTRRGHKLKGRELSLRIDANGYRHAMLHRDGQKRGMPAHQAVLYAFVGPRPDGMETRHLDGNPSNNHLSNLTWGTKAENAQDILRHGMHANANKTECPAGHAYTPENTLMHPRGCRICRECKRTRDRERQAQHAARRRERRAAARTERAA
jgi:hypothetical protein